MFRSRALTLYKFDLTVHLGKFRNYWSLLLGKEFMQKFHMHYFISVFRSLSGDILPTMTMLLSHDVYFITKKGEKKYWVVKSSVICS